MTGGHRQQGLPTAALDRPAAANRAPATRTHARARKVLRIAEKINYARIWTMSKKKPGPALRGTGITNFLQPFRRASADDASASPAAAIWG